MGLFSNKTLIVTAISWSIAQTVKIVLGIIREKRFNFSWLVETGGMPSSHSAGVAALVTALGFEVGVRSPLFAFGFVFAFITMFDAQTWRRSVGVQAQILNRIIEDIQKRRKVEEEKIRELMGHTPIEVFVGALIGIGIALFFYR